MAVYPASLESVLDLTQVDATCSQRWILTAMQQHGAVLVSMLWRILGNEQDVCDIYQETFLRLAHLENQAKPDNVRAYLFRTASNTAITMLRREQLKVQYQRQLCEKYKPHTHDPAGYLDTMDLQQRLRDAIAKLPDYLGDVVVLRDLAEMPYKQVAKILGITTAAARVYRHKALKLLAMCISEK
ncbi:MAG: RNA polymerase sigma factor [Phycisphaerae bacterium]|nr:RNA polymerase sigma factor [Phycisphaerae bacterium]